MKTPTKFSREEQVRKAEAIYAAMNDSEKLGCKFGMFPAQPMNEAEKEGYNGHQLAVDLMECASLGSRQGSAK